MKIRIMQQQVLGRIFTMNRRSVGNISPPIQIRDKEERRTSPLLRQRQGE